MLKFKLIIVVIGVVIGCGGKNNKKPKVVAGSATVDDSAGASSTDKTNTNDNSIAMNDKDSSLHPVIYFDFDSTSLDDEARKLLAENAAWLKEESSRTMTIEGHTDETGTTDYNLALGERRARETRDFLIRMGIDGKRISIITYGEERPTGSDDSKNRRSMFIATKP